MQKIIFFLVSLFFIGCATTSSVKPEPKSIHRSKYILQSNPWDKKINIVAKMQILRNLEDFKALLGTAQHYLASCQTNLIKMRKKMVRGTNAVLSSSERNKLARQITAKQKDCLNIFDHALFNNQRVFGKNNKSRQWRTTLAENQKTVAFNISAISIISSLKQIKLLGCAAKDFSSGIVRVDQALDKINLERSIVGAFDRRIESARDWQLIFVKAYRKAEKNEKFPTAKAAVLFHIRKLEDKLYELSVQAANGIWIKTNRAQMQIGWQQTIAELNRLERETSIKTIATGADWNALHKQSSSEQEMLRIAALLLVKNKS